MNDHAHRGKILNTNMHHNYNILLDIVLTTSDVKTFNVEYNNCTYHSVHRRFHHVLSQHIGDEADSAEVIVQHKENITM